MFYELNVSLNGKHLFATAQRSITSETKLKELRHVFKGKFPKSEGYKVTATRLPLLEKCNRP